MAQTQKVKVKVFKYLNYLFDKDNPKTLYKPALVTPTVVTAQKYLKNVANETGLSVFQVKAVLSSIFQTAGDYLTLGNAVQVDEDFGTLKPYIKVKSVEDPKKCDARCIVGVGIKFLPTGAMKNLLGDTQFVFVGTTEGGDVDDSEVVDTAGGGGTGNGSQNEQQGNQQTGGNLTPAEVTYTFKYHDNTEDSRVGLPGAAVDAPEPDEGYRWNEAVPSVFGNVNKTFTEVAIAQGGGTGNTGGGTGGTETYTATLHIGSSYSTLTGEAGSPLDLPQLESGYTWPSNMPTVMPAMDFTACAIEGEQDTSTEYTLTIQHQGETLRTEQLHADDIVFLGTAPEGYKWTNTPRYSKMPARDWTVSTQANA